MRSAPWSRRLLTCKARCSWVEAPCKSPPQFSVSPLALVDRTTSTAPEACASLLKRCRNMLEKEQKKVRNEYESRFRELERERVAIQDDKAKVRLLSCFLLVAHR